MKPKIFAYVMLALAGISINSCTKDFIEKNISNQSIQLMAPANRLNTPTETQTFWWNTLDGAEQYNLQIVKGSFSYVVQLELDTNITTNKFTFTLSPGNYQWRVEGVNNGGNTPYSVFSLTIDSTSSVSSQIVILVSPPNNFWSNSISNTFKWDSIPGSTDYRFQIINKSTSNIVTDTTFKGISLTRTLIEGSYTWQVRAQNNSSNSQYTAFTLGIDTTKPNIPVLLTPKNDSTAASRHVNFTWSRGTTSGSPINDSLYIYSDPGMTSIVKDTLTSLTSYSDSLNTGSYYWRVRSIDAAGNKSAYSQLNKFITP